MKDLFKLQTETPALNGLNGATISMHKVRVYGIPEIGDIFVPANIPYSPDNIQLSFQGSGFVIHNNNTSAWISDESLNAIVFEKYRC